MKWDIFKKPPSNICPQIYCFHWIPAGGAAEIVGHANKPKIEFQEEEITWKEFPQGGCSCSFGLCTRMHQGTGDCDWYEPSEPLLEKDGLPWFYFIPSTANLSQQFHERYLKESQNLWGNNENDSKS